MSNRLTSISYLRSFSAILIFACHVAFIAGAFESAMWFNVGVPLFFIISAYLLALKSHISTNLTHFYKRRLISIFPSYLIYIASVVIVLFVIGKAPDIKSIICYGLGLSGLTDTNILGLGHLWFITVLLICYLITPFLDWIIDKRFFIPAISAFLILQFLTFFIIHYPAYGIHVASYVLVYCFYHKKPNKNITKTQVKIWFTSAAILSLMRLLFDRHFMEGDYEAYYYYDALFQPIARFALAMCIFTFFIYQSKRIEQWSLNHLKGHKVINAFSESSYEVYLTHQFILLAFWEFFPFLHNGIGLVIWVILSFVATIANTLILIRLKSLATNKLNIINNINN